MEAADKKRIRLDKKNLSRRQHTQESRATIFMNEYIKEKYRETYEEAVAFYNYVNELHPKKNDLRKTQEFKAMKNGMIFVTKRPKITKQSFTSIPTTGEHEIAIIATDEQPESMYLAVQPSAEQAETVASSTEQAETVASSTEQAETMASSTEQAETVASSTEQAETVPKTMQLHIPLMSSEQISTTVLEESLRTTLLDDEIQSTLDEEIPEEIYGKILAELRVDPDLANLMEDMEKDIDEQDIDLPIEEDRLELELQNWGMW